MKVYWKFISSEAAEVKEEIWVFYLKEWEGWAADELQPWKREMWLFLVKSLMKNNYVSLE